MHGYSDSSVYGLLACNVANDPREFLDGLLARNVANDPCELLQRMVIVTLGIVNY